MTALRGAARHLAAIFTATGLLMLPAPLPAQGKDEGEGEDLTAPCLGQMPDLAAYADAFIAVGWAPVTDPTERATAIAALSQPRMSYENLPRTMETLDDLQGFLDRAERWGARLTDARLFARDGVVASVENDAFEAGEVRLVCTFAAAALPVAAEMLTGDTRQFDGTLLIAATALPPLPDGSSRLIVDAVRLEAPLMLRPALTGRESIIVSHDFRVPE